MIFKSKTIDRNKVFMELDKLNAGERAKKVALMSKEYSKKEYAKFLKDILKGGQYEGNLALIGAEAIKDEDIIVSALQHESIAVNLKAVALMAKIVKDEDIIKTITGLSYECRNKLCHLIVKYKRKELAEKLLPLVYEKFGYREALIILPICKEETVEKWLEKIGYKTNLLGRYAIFHPQVTASYFKNCLKETSESQRQYVWYRFYDAVKILCRVMPEFILDTLIEFGPKKLIFDSMNELGYLVKSNPEKMFKIIISEESRQDLLRCGIDKSILRYADLFTIDMWVRIGRIFVNKPLEISKVLKVLKGEDKVEFYKKVYEVEEFKTRIIPEFIIELLPKKLRIEEVRRMLLIDKIRENSIRKSILMSYLDIDEVRKYFEEESKSSDVEKRSKALSALILSSDLKRNGSMKETLNYLNRIKNDQDPVKCRVSSALRKASYKNYGDDEAEILKNILESMISSRDASFDTISNIYELSLKILQGRYKEKESEIFKVAVNIFVKTASKDGIIKCNTPLKRLNRELDKIVFKEFSHVIISEMKHENYNLLFAFASSLGKRAFEITELQELIKDVVLKEKNEYIVSTAITLYLGDKKTRDKRVKELLNLDKSYIKFKEVYLHLHRRRQELLDDFIVRRALRGKFFSGRTIFVLPVESGFYRWLPRQQKLFTSIILSAVIDDSYNSSQRCSYIRMMSDMPVIDFEIFSKLIEDKDDEISEIALQSLAGIDKAGRAVEILLDNLDGNKAKVAMYSLNKCLKRIHEEKASELIKSILERDNNKITVRKEAIRLLCKYKSDDSFKLLIKEYKKENIHKDVKITIGQAVKGYLGYEKSWEILEEIANDNSYELSSCILNQFYNEIDVEYRERYLELLIKLSKSDNKEKAISAFNTMRYWKEINEELIAKTASEEVSNLERKDVWKSASYTLRYICRDGNINKYITSIYERLSVEDNDVKYEKINQRDMPHRQRLEALTNNITNFDYLTKLSLKPLYLNIINVLKGKYSYINLQLSLYNGLIDWKNPFEASGIISEAACFSKISPYYINVFSMKISDNIKQNESLWQAEDLLEIVDNILERECIEAVYVCFEILKAVGKKLLWNEECRSYLNKFRNHSNKAISIIALNTWYMEE